MITASVHSLTTLDNPNMIYWFFFASKSWRWLAKLIRKLLINYLPYGRKTVGVI